MSRATDPTLPGIVTADGVNVVVWCEYCHQLHHHGHGGPDKPIGYGNGHRVAHCATKPQRHSGYFIREIARFETEDGESIYEREWQRHT